MTSIEPKQIPQWVLATTLGAIALVVIVGGGLFAYNQFTIARGSLEPAPASAGTSAPAAAGEDDGDDSGATSALTMLVGALFIYIETGAAEDCEFIAYLTPELAAATPLDSYRGTYEKITAQTRTIVDSCLGDPASADAISLAGITRPLVTEILDERNVLGGNWTAGELPVAGRQAG